MITDHQYTNSYAGINPNKAYCEYERVEGVPCGNHLNLHADVLSRVDGTETKTHTCGQPHYHVDPAYCGAECFDDDEPNPCGNPDCLANCNVCVVHCDKFFDNVDSTTTGELTTGVKNDFADGKTQRYDLIATGPWDDLAKLLGFGAQKYAARNWELGFDWSRPYNAIIRHLNAFWNGEEIDPDSGAPHMVAVMCNAMFLAEFVRTHPELDDRPKP